MNRLVVPVETTQRTDDSLCNHRAQDHVRSGHGLMQRLFGTARLVWAVIILALFEAAGILTLLPPAPKIRRPSRALRHAVFFMSVIMAVLFPYSLILNQSASMAVLAMGSAAQWITPLQMVSTVMNIQSAGGGSVDRALKLARTTPYQLTTRVITLLGRNFTGQPSDHARNAAFAQSNFEYRLAGTLPVRPKRDPVPLLPMAKTSMMANINDRDRSAALPECMHMNFDDLEQSSIAMLDSGCNNIMMPMDDEVKAKVINFDENGRIAGEDVQQSFTTETSDTLGVTDANALNTTPDCKLGLMEQTRFFDCVPNDETGNCLFESLVTLSEGQFTAGSLREETCNRLQGWLESNNDTFLEDIRYTLQHDEHPVTADLKNVAHASPEECHDYICKMRLDGTHGSMLEMGAAAAALGKSVELIGQVPNNPYLEVTDSWTISPDGYYPRSTMTDERKCSSESPPYDNPISVLYKHQHFQALRECHAPTVSAVDSPCPAIRMNHDASQQIHPTPNPMCVTSGTHSRQHRIKRGELCLTPRDLHIEECKKTGMSHRCPRPWRTYWTCTRCIHLMVTAQSRKSSLHT